MGSSQVCREAIRWLCIVVITLGVIWGCQNAAPVTGAASGLARARIPTASGPSAAENYYPDAKPNIADGRSSYLQSCAECHGDYGSKAAGTERVNFADRRFFENRSNKEIFRLITEGSPSGHRGFKETLTYQDRWNAAFYVLYLFIVGRAPGPEGADRVTARDATELLSRTKVDFGKRCSVCHGDVGRGDGPLSHHMEPPPRNFHDAEWMAGKTNAHLRERIKEGVPNTGMPPWKDVLTDEEIDGIVAHIRALGMVK